MAGVVPAAVAVSLTRAAATVPVLAVARLRLLQGLDEANKGGSTPPDASSGRRTVVTATARLGYGPSHLAGSLALASPAAAASQAVHAAATGAVGRAAAVERPAPFSVHMLRHFACLLQKLQHRLS